MFQVLVYCSEQGIKQTHDLQQSLWKVQISETTIQSQPQPICFPVVHVQDTQKLHWHSWHLRRHWCLYLARKFFALVLDAGSHGHW